MWQDLMENQSETHKRSRRIGLENGPLITDEDVDFNS